MNLKKLLLTCLFSLSLPAFAQVAEGLSEDWVKVNEGAGFAQYANFKSIKIDGPRVMIWEARFDEPDNNSRKVYMEYHCKNNQARILSILLYKDTKFSGVKEMIQTPSAPIHIPPDSYLSDMHEIVCGAAAKLRK